MTRAPEELYRIYFHGTKYSEPAWEVVKLIDLVPVVTYIIRGSRCQCPAFERRNKKCRHLYMKEFFERHDRPSCFLRSSGTINVFLIPLTLGEEDGSENNPSPL